MPDFDEFDLERTVDRAWGAFQSRLADHLADMGDDDVLVVALAGGDDNDSGAMPYVQFSGWAGDRLRGEVASNHYLRPAHRLHAESEAQLEAAGWLSPTHAPDEEADAGSTNFHLDVPRSYADRLAAMAVTALRDVWGVPHPTFLSADVPGGHNQAPDLGLASPTRDAVADMPRAVMPEDTEHLRALVDEALTPVFGHVPEKDADGDIPVRSGSALVFVRVLPDLPVVGLFAPLVRGITGRTRAAEVLSDLNRTWTMVKFVLVDDGVLAVIQLPAVPFVAEHLRDMLGLLSQVADALDDELADRLEGRLPFADVDPPGAAVRLPARTGSAPDGSGDELPAELLTVLQLDVGGQSSLSPEAVAHICGRDRDTLLRFIRLSSEQEIAWRSSAREAQVAGDREEAEACTVEATAWESTVELLRRALRVVVLGSGTPGPRSSSWRVRQLGLFDEPGEATLFDEPDEP